MHTGRHVQRQAGKDFGLETDITAGCRQRGRQAVKKACIEAGNTEEQHAKRQGGIKAGIYRGRHKERHAGRQGIMIKRQAL